MGFSASIERKRSDAYTVSLEGDLDVSAAGPLKRLLFELIADRAHEVEIDVRRVALVDGTAAGVLIIAEQALQRRGGTLRLRGWGLDEVERLFALNGDVNGHGPRGPRLVFFYQQGSERTRQVDGLVATVLRHQRHNGAFVVQRLAIEEHPDLAARFGVEAEPTIFVIEGKRVCARIVDPRGVHELERQLAPWLGQRGRQELEA